MQIPPPYEKFLAEVLITEQDLQKRIAELGAQISRDYQGKELLLICILRGGIMFLTDLMRQLSVPHAVDFMAVSSYGAGARESSGQGRIADILLGSVSNEVVHKSMVPVVIVRVKEPAKRQS